MKKVLFWFFQNPTAMTALISILIALLAYLYQRREKKKYRAYEIAVDYANDIIPRMRIVNSIIESLGLQSIFKKLEGFTSFDNLELISLLKKQDLCINDIEARLKSIESLHFNVAQIGNCIDFQSKTNWKLISEVPEDKVFDLNAKVFKRFTIDTLNKMEAMAMLMRYNLADEKMIYQSLHQTFLSSIFICYYFIAVDNFLGDNRYFDNMIWLYWQWNHRKQKERKKTLHNSTPYKSMKL